MLTTVLGLFTWRPARRWLPILGPLLLVLWVRNRAGGFAAVLALCAVGVGWACCSDLIVGRLARCAAADRFMRAVVEVNARTTQRWLRNPYPRARSTLIRDGVAVHDFALAPGMDLELLAGYASRLAAALDAAQVSVEPHPTRPAGWCKVTVAAQLVQARRPMPVVHAPDDENVLTKLRRGHR